VKGARGFIPYFRTTYTDPYEELLKSSDNEVREYSRPAENESGATTRTVSRTGLLPVRLTNLAAVFIISVLSRPCGGNNDSISGTRPKVSVLYARHFKNQSEISEFFPG